MAYQAGPYTNLNNALDLWRGFLLSEGWTINQFTVGAEARLHVQKIIRGRYRFFNFLSGAGLAFGTYGDSFSGIGVNGSTGYNAGLSADAQPGYTTDIYTTAPGTGDSNGGCLDHMYNLGGDYFFFATDTSASAVFSVGSPDTEYAMMTIGVTDEGYSMYAASGGQGEEVSSDGSTRAAYLASVGASYSNYFDGASGLFDGTGWFVSDQGQGGVPWGLNNQIRATGRNFRQDGSQAEQICRYSPDGFRGNAPMAPCALTVTQAVGSVFYPVGTLEGVYFLNAKNYTDTQEITYGGDTFKIFANNRAQIPYGVAFKK